MTETNTNTKKKEKPTIQEFNESVLVIQKQLSESLFKISEHMREMEQDPKMRGGKRYAQACRNFASLSKRFTENMKLVVQAEQARHLESESKDFFERIRAALEAAAEEKDNEEEGAEEQQQQQEEEEEDSLDKKMMMTIKEARRLKRQLMCKKSYRSRTHFFDGGRRVGKRLRGTKVGADRSS